LARLVAMAVEPILNAPPPWAEVLVEPLPMKEALVMSRVFRFC
jgi:hypothetical protein